jgi:uncharacterized coiled-coil protein SlyX
MSDTDLAARLQTLEAQVTSLTATVAALSATFVEEASLSSGMPPKLIEDKIAKRLKPTTPAPGAPGSIRR